MEKVTSLNWKKMLEILGRLDFFKSFSSYEKRKTIDLKTQFLIFQDGEKLVEEGSKDRAFYIIIEGDVNITKGNNGQVIASLHAGDFFGEVAFLTDTTRTANVIADGMAIVFKVDRELFECLESDTREKFKDNIIKKLVSRIEEMNNMFLKINP